MKISEFKQRSAAELQKILQESKEKLRVLRFDLSAGKLKNVSEIKKIRKDVARIKTILNENK